MAEQLENRTLMTVVFPLLQYGNETPVYENSDGLQDPIVNLIFAGNWSNYESDKATLLTRFESIITGPYLSALSQYSASGTASFGTTWNDPNNTPGATLSSAPGGSDLQAFLQHSIATYGTDLGIHGLYHSPMYIVIQDPTSSMGDNGGFNLPGTYASSVTGQSEPIQMEWVGTSLSSPGHVNLDWTTAAFGHELAERCVNNATLFYLPSAYNVNGQPKLVQVCDGEMEHNYLYRLNGAMVQAYYSALDDAAVVPDVDYNSPSEKFTLNPLPWVNGYPTGQYNMVVDGDQLANHNDFIVIDQTSAGGASITLNSETVNLEPGELHSLVVSSGTGQDSIFVNALVAPTTILSASPANGPDDNVLVGNGNTSYLNAPLTIINTLGYDVIDVSDSENPYGGGEVDVLNKGGSPGVGEVTGIAPEDIYFTYSQTRSLYIDDGSGGANLVNVVNAGVPIFVDGHNEPNGSPDYFETTNPSGLAAPATFHDTGPYTIQVYDVSDTTARSITLANGASGYGAITGFGGAAINYAYANANVLINVDSSANTGTISATGAPTTFSGGSFRELQTAAGTTATLSGVSVSGGYEGGILNRGTLTVTGSSIIGNSNPMALGGGISNLGSLTITHSKVQGNSTPGDGGGIENDQNATLVIDNSLVTGNYAGGEGGGVYNLGTVTLLNSTFSANDAASGGAIYNDANAVSNITNSILYGDEGVEIVNNAFGGGVIYSNYNDIEGSTPGGHDISSAPGFTSSSNFALANQSSPAIDAGLNSAVPAYDFTDLAGNPRIVHGTVDMGAYEFQGPFVTVVTPSLQYVQQPSNVTVNQAMSPAVVVGEYINGVLDTTDNSFVSLYLNSKLIGTAQLIGGVATFNNLVFSGTGTFNLVALDGGDNDATSNSFQVLAVVPPPALGFGALPNTPTSGVAFSPSLTVTGGANGSTVYLSTTINGVAGSTLQASVVGGVATFPYTPTASGAYTFTATDTGDVQAYTAFSVEAPASAPPTILHLVFATQPGSIMAGDAVASPSSPIIVYVEDQNGTLMTDDMVTISVPMPFSASGQYSVAAVNGVATFGTSYLHSIYVGLNFNDAAPNTCYLVASDTTPADTTAIPATSSGFLVTPNVTEALAVSSTTATAASTFSLTVQTNDLYDDLSTDLSGASITLSVAAGPTGGTLQGNLTATLQGSQVTFTDLSLNIAGGYTIIATDANSPSLHHTGGGVDITAAAPTQLAFVQQPATVAVGATITPSVVVAVEDSFGNVVSSDNSDQVSLAIASGPTSALSGSTTVTVQNGLATFSDISIGQTGTYTLNASSGAYPAVISNSFTIVTPSVIYVDQKALGNNSGGSWTNAFTTLQPALAAAVPGDAIEVAEGDYSPSTNLSDPSATFQLIDGLFIQGGYETGGANGPSPAAYPTILDGLNSYCHVVTAMDTDATAILQGFTITGGNASGGEYSSSGLGGGLYINGGSATISDCTFTNDTASLGGAVYMSGDGSAAGSLIDCSFTGNTAIVAGGAMSFADSSPLLVNDLFAGNSAPSAGAILNSDSSPTITNCTFTDNAGFADGAIVDDESSPTITNCILWNDDPTEIVNEGGAATVNYSDIPGGYSGTSNLNQDPTLSINFHLLTGSVAVGAGDINAPGLTEVQMDLGGQARTNNGTVDLGAYEGAVEPVLYVDASATGSNNGASWSDAFTSLQSALSIAVSGYTIEIAQGDYSPGSSPSDTFQLLNGVTIQGGYLSGGFSGPDPAAYQTKLDGAYNGGNNNHVVTADNNNATAVLEGVTIENGDATDSGGGLYVNDASPTITDCTFANNSAATDGGAVYISGATMTLTNCVFSGNTAVDGGGAIYIYADHPTLINCLFVGNSSNTGGAVIDVLSQPTFTNCTFAQNTTENGYYGTISDQQDSFPTLVNCILWNDVLLGQSNEIYTDGSTGQYEAYVSNSDISGGSGSYYLFIGSNNIDADPLFVNPDDGNYEPGPGSPCIATGNAAAAGLQGITTDLAGNARFVNGEVDMGAYEVQQAGIYWTGDADGINWDVAGNWSDDLVPTQQDNVIIGTGFSNVQVSSGSFAVNTLTASSPVEVTAGGTLSLDGFSTISDGLTIDSGGTLDLAISGAATNPGPLVVAGLNIISGGILNVGSSAMIVQGGSLSAITAEIASAFDNGTWMGVGITSSIAQEDPNHETGLGVILNNDGAGNPLYGTGGTLGLFDGYSPAVTDVLVKPTIYGDTDLAGGIDASDYSKIDNGFLNHLTGWANGDFNYDGVINGSDYTLIDNDFNTQGTQGVTIEATIAAPGAIISSSSAASRSKLSNARLKAALNRPAFVPVNVFQTATPITFAGMAVGSVEAFLQKKDLLDQLGESPTA